MGLSENNDRGEWWKEWRDCFLLNESGGVTAGQL